MLLEELIRELEKLDAKHGGDGLEVHVASHVEDGKLAPVKGVVYRDGFRFAGIEPDIAIY